MKILVIDDLRNFIEDYPDDEIYVARTSEEALRLFQEHDSFNLVYFDHDLGWEDTTRVVASMLEEKAFFGEQFPIGECFVHTANSVGAKWLMSALKSAGYKVSRIDAEKLFISEIPVVE